MSGARIRLTLRALPDSLPVSQPLRLALKTLLRRDRRRIGRGERSAGWKIEKSRLTKRIL